jgi:hypothetical protein
MNGEEIYNKSYVYDYSYEHSYEEKVINPTCTENGKIIYTCSDCGHRYEETLYALGHDEEIILGPTLYLGKNDDGSRYYEIDDPNHIPDKNNDIIVDNSTENVVE